MIEATKTYSVSSKNIQKKWIMIDASGLVLGRLASIIAYRLAGKHRPDYTPHMDCGDNIVVVNADKVHLTGKKRQDKRYYWHTGYPGGIKDRTMRQLLEGKKPETVLENAVKRMLTRSPLGYKRMTNLHLYSGEKHPHIAQSPQPIDVASLNPKNTQYRNFKE